MEFTRLINEKSIIFHMNYAKPMGFSAFYYMTLIYTKMDLQLYEKAYWTFQQNVGD